MMTYSFARRIWHSAAALAVLSASVFAQAKYTPPKAAWDPHADLSGIWEARGTAGDSVEPRTAAWGMRASMGYITDPAPSGSSDGIIPYKPEALAKRDANFRNRAALDSINKCYFPGVPRLMYMGYAFQLVQSPKYIAIISEFHHTYRTIYTNGSTHLEGADFYNGDSRGHWEGDTLVVDVADFNDQTWFDKAGNYHSDALHVVERYTRIGPDSMTYTATVEDPKVFTRPWTITVPLFRHTEPNYRLLEYECQSYREDEAKLAGSQ